MSPPLSESRRDREQQLHYHICFIIMLLAIAGCVGHQVRRVKALSDYFEHYAERDILDRCRRSGTSVIVAGDLGLEPIPMSYQSGDKERNSICVILNPAAGKTRARHRLEAMGTAWDGRFELWQTKRPGHATELAREATERGFEVVAAAGGDGTVHEVANGILQAERTGVHFGILPLGSANDYAFSVRQDRVEQEGTAEATTQLVDVGRVRIDSGEQRYFVCCMGIGFSSSVTGEARKIPRLQGKMLYGLAAMRAMWCRWQHLDLQLRLDDQPPIEQPTLMLSFMIGQREGGFTMAPGSRLDKGDLRVIQAGRLSRWEVLRLLPGLASTGPPTSHPKLSFARCRAATVTARQPLSVHTDGEILCLPQDRVFRLEVELLAARLPVQIIDLK